MGEKEKENNRNWKRGKGGVRTWSDSGWKKGVGGGGWSRKRKDAGWKRTEGKEACKVAFRLSREKHRPRRIGVNGVSPRGNSIGPIFVSDLLPRAPLLPLIFIMDTLKFRKYKEIIREMTNWNNFSFLYWNYSMFRDSSNDWFERVRSISRGSRGDF